MNDNMKIWSEVETTDPAHTKPVNLGRRAFTSIDAMYQVKRCTEMFGPVGEGWEYSCVHSIHIIDSNFAAAICDLTIGWGERLPSGAFRNSYGPVRGVNWIKSVGKNGEVYDEDAPKKAMTDALTKALSHLGFSADVFLGKFDDNKYVAQVTRLHSGQEAAPPRVALPDIMQRLPNEIGVIIDPAALNSHYKKNEPEIMQLNKPQQQTVIGWYGERKRKLSGEKGKVTDVLGAG